MTRQELEQYHRENPQVYEAFEKFTFEVIRSGRKRFSARTVYERIRWYSMIEAKGQFKINDHQVPFYARHFEEMHPEHKGFFSKRRSVADLPGQIRLPGIDR